MILNNIYPVDCCLQNLNIPPMPIDYGPRQNKRVLYSTDMTPDVLYFAKKNTFITVTTPWDYPQVILLTFDVANAHHTTIIDVNNCVNL